MELGHAYSVLVVSASAKFNESVRGLLPERFYWPVTVLTDAAGARRELLENSCDLVVINTPLPDEFGTRLAQDICQHSAAGVLLLVKAEHFPDIDGRLTPQGVLVLSKPMSTQLFTQSLRLLCGTRERLRGLEKKNAGDPPCEPGQVAADRGTEYDGEGGPPIHRKAGDGSLRDEAGRGGADLVDL